MKHRKFYMIYSSFLLLFLSISLATNCAFGDLMWIDDGNFPGGPLAFYQDNSSAWYNTFGTAADVAVFVMADGLMLYRCFMFWRDHRWVVILPALLYVASFVMAIITTIESALPGASIFQGLPTNFSISWLALTVSFNLIVTLTIIGRLLVTYLTVRGSLGPALSRTYIDVSAVLVESALPFSVLGIGFLVCQVLNSDVVFAFAFVWGTFLAVSPQLIIYRVALGTAWSKDTMYTTNANMDFAQNNDDGFYDKESAGDSSGLGGSTRM